MITRIKSDKIITPSGLFEGYIYIENGKITELTINELDFDSSFDMSGLYVSPGFIELHTHGGAGHPFLTDDENDIIKGVDFHLSMGITSICPTVSAAPIAIMHNAVSAIDKAMKSGKTKANILGAHLEGPYLSKKQAGAQSSDFITPPKKADYTELYREFPSAIARWTYAPEQDKNREFTDFLKEKGILPSMGHTDAIYDDAKKALDKGCRLVTHLYSCTSTITREQGFRRLGVIETAFLHGELYAEVIADGKHLPKELLKMIIKIKGIDRVIAVSDCLHITGTDIKSGDMSGVEFIVEEGVCRLADRSAFAGSVATARQLLTVLTKEAELDICDAVTLMTKNPADIMGLNKGVLESCRDADIIAFDEDFKIKKVFVGGNEVI